jgi:molybdenum cofactor cytidylyltransferase
MAAVIAAIVLAAGASRRYGSPKQLESLDGENWVYRTARVALEAGCSPVHVVTGAHADLVGLELQSLPRAIVVHHAGWEQGVGSSIAAGIQALATSAPQGVLLLTCDQLALDTQILHRLIDAFDGEPRRIVASAYAGTVGIPALFGAGYFDRLGRLDGDRGAKPLLLDQPDWRVDIEWAAGADDRDRRRETEG